MSEITNSIKSFGTRAAVVQVPAVGDAAVADTRALSFSLSSDARVDMGSYYEVLSHEPGAIVDDRLRAGLPLLHNHDTHQHIGRMPQYAVDGGKLSVSGRFGNSSLAKEKQADFADGILSDVSVGYRVLEGKWQPGKDGEKPTLHVSKWQPYEASLVSVAADISVGAGRSAEFKDSPVVVTNLAEVEKPAAEPKNETRSVTVENTPVLDIATAITADRERGAKLRKIGELTLEQPGFKGRALPFTMADVNAKIDAGVTESEFRGWVGDKVIEAMGKTPQGQTAAGVVNDMEKREKRAYSVRTLLLAGIAAKHNKSVDIGFEREASAEIAKRTGVTTHGLLIPNDFKFNQERAMQASNSGNASIQGIETVPEVIEFFRNKAKTLALGAKLWNNLHGAIKLPRQITPMADNWAAETVAIAESDLTFDFVELSPKRHGVRTQYTMELLAQSTPDIESFIRSEMAKVFALGTDFVTIAGSGTNGQPTGILNTTGVASVTPSGVALPSGKLGFDYADILSFEELLAENNADVNDMGWMLTPGVRSRLKATQTFPGALADPLYPARPVRYANGLEDGPLGYKAGVTNQLPKNLGSSTNLQAIIFGDFSQVIVADWGAVEIIFDEITQASAGIYNVNLRQLQDVEIRHPQSFVAGQVAVA